jgi:hypothetical protein
MNDEDRKAHIAVWVFVVDSLTAEGGEKERLIGIFWGVFFLPFSRKRKRKSKKIYCGIDSLARTGKIQALIRNNLNCHIAITKHVFVHDFHDSMHALTRWFVVVK